MIKINKEVVEKDSLKKAAIYAKTLKENFRLNIKNSKTKLKVLRESKIFEEDFLYNKVTPYSKYLFLDIAKSSPDVMQLRYIDTKGNEILRVQRDEADKKVTLVDKKYLQNKSDRYYFKAIMKLDDGEYWFSKLDLNIEHGKIEIPIRPVLRIGTPYYYKGEKKGILIINIFMNNFLNSLVTSDIYNIYLVDKENNILKNTLHKNEWNKYLHPHAVLQKKFLSDISDSCYYSLKLCIGEQEDLRLIVIPNSSYIDSQIKENFYQFFWVILIVFLFSVPLSYLMSILPTKLKSRVDELNMQLKQESDEKDVLLSLFDYSNAVLFKWNNDKNWSVSFVSKSVENLLKYRQNDFESNRITYINCIHSDDLLRVQKEVIEAIRSKVYFFTHKPYRVLTKEKKIKWILNNTVIVRDENNKIINFLGYLIDITDIKEKEFELENLARIDQLTKISNRLYLDEILVSQYYRFNRYSEKCSLIIIDIDYFKSVNDQYGHLVGDKILIEFANLLKNSIRKDDVIGRWGGEEFLIILPHTNLEQAEFLAEKLCKIVAEHEFSIVGHKTASFGVTTFINGLTVEECVDMADCALYEAKEAGRNIVKVHQIKASIKKK
jgi:diguanylate cyclase (GGDEF)-like protein